MDACKNATYLQNTECKTIFMQKESTEKDKNKILAKGENKINSIFVCKIEIRDSAKIIMTLKTQVSLETES